MPLAPTLLMQASHDLQRAHLGTMTVKLYNRTISQYEKRMFTGEPHLSLSLGAAGLAQAGEGGGRRPQCGAYPGVGPQVTDLRPKETKKYIHKDWARPCATTRRTFDAMLASAPSSLPAFPSPVPVALVGWWQGVRVCVRAAVWSVWGRGGRRGAVHVARAGHAAATGHTPRRRARQVGPLSPEI